MKDMGGLRALVLGGRGDIGNAIAGRLAENGCEVISVGRKDFDLQNQGQIDDYLNENGCEYDVLVHSSGLNNPALFEDLTDAEIRKSLEVNLHSFLYIAKRCLPYWKQRFAYPTGSISNLAAFW